MEGFIDSVKKTYTEFVVECITKKYIDFSGRARRSELWYFALFVFVISIIISIIEKILNIDYPKGDGGPISSLFSLAILLPSLAVSVRRLHDIGKNGWWILLGLLVPVGTIILIIWSCADSQYGENEYGPNPKNRNRFSDNNKLKKNQAGNISRLFLN